MPDILAAFRWRDALDIFLVSLIVYRLLVAFRGTRATQMLIGLAILLAAALGARRLELYSLGWLFDTFWAVWAIGLVVLFQPELRRVLARLGQGQFLQLMVGSGRAARTELVDAYNVGERIRQAIAELRIATESDPPVTVRATASFGIAAHPESKARDGEDLTDRFWPANFHVLAKDILKFHAVIWPAMLLAAGIELPRHEYIHGYLRMKDASGAEHKMSKSLGNVLDPFEVMDTFGTDALRYYCFREVSFGQDGGVSTITFGERYETELANEFGNLASRTLAMIDRFFDDFLGYSGLGRSRPSSSLASAARDLTGSSSQSLWYPQVEVRERDGKLVVCADLPGARKEDVHVELRDTAWRAAAQSHKTDAS